MELANENNIYLLREGMFYRAYNRSAMRIVTYLKPFKVNHKYVKTVQQEILYVGFPCSSLPSIKKLAIDKGWQVTDSDSMTPSHAITKQNDIDSLSSMIVVQGVSNKEEDYQAWVEKQFADSEGVTPSHPLTKPSELAKLITDFPIENATPMEALMFVNKLKQLVRHGNVR